MFYSHARVSAPWLWQCNKKASWDTLRLWLSIKQGKVKTEAYNGSYEGLVVARGVTNIVSMQGKHTTCRPHKRGHDSTWPKFKCGILGCKGSLEMRFWMEFWFFKIFIFLEKNHCVSLNTYYASSMDFENGLKCSPSGWGVHDSKVVRMTLVRLHRHNMRGIEHE